MNFDKKVFKYSSSLFTLIRMAWNTRASIRLRCLGGVTTRTASTRSNTDVNGRCFTIFLAIILDRLSSPYLKIISANNLSDAAKKVVEATK